MTSEKKSRADISATDLAREYESYFDDMEKANKIPLDFRTWLKENYNYDLAE